MKGFRYFEPDLTSFLDLMLENASDINRGTVDFDMARSIINVWTNRSS